MTDIVTIGWLTIDDIVLEDYTCKPRTIGGGALYSAIGARIWHAPVGLHTVTGNEYFGSVIQEIKEYGLDTTGVRAIPGNGLELWLLHESATEKQQVPKLTSSTANEMDAGRGSLPEAYSTARGFHIAPQTADGSLENVNLLSTLPSRPIVTLDLLADAYVDTAPYRDLSFLDRITAFLPSKEEVERIWRPKNLSDWVRSKATGYARCVAVKMGVNGSLVCDGTGRSVYHVPAFTTQVVDTTGAGDSYCGGFLAGLVLGRPVLECAAMGTVSASFTVEFCGALAMRKPEPGERDKRLQTVLRNIEEYGDGKLLPHRSGAT
jgi:sugar/nucleoside kinase (ribokinase family)